MKNILIIIAVCSATILNAQFAISDAPSRGEVEVVNESQGIEFSFPVLETPYNLANPPSFKFHYFGNDRATESETGEVKNIEIRKSFKGLDEFLKSQGYNDLGEIKKQGLKVYFTDIKKRG